MTLSQRIQTAGIWLLGTGVTAFIVCILTPLGGFEVYGSCIAVALVGAALVCATLERGQS